MLQSSCSLRRQNRWGRNSSQEEFSDLLVNERQARLIQGILRDKKVEVETEEIRSLSVLFASKIPEYVNNDTFLNAFVGCCLTLARVTKETSEREQALFLAKEFHRVTKDKIFTSKLSSLMPDIKELPTIKNLMSWKGDVDLIFKNESTRPLHERFISSLIKRNGDSFLLDLGERMKKINLPHFGVQCKLSEYENFPTDRDTNLFEAKETYSLLFDMQKALYSALMEAHEAKYRWIVHFGNGRCAKTLEKWRQSISLFTLECKRMIAVESRHLRKRCQSRRREGDAMAFLARHMLDASILMQFKEMEKFSHTMIIKLTKALLHYRGNVVAVDRFFYDHSTIPEVYLSTIEMYYRNGKFDKAEKLLRNFIPILSENRDLYIKCCSYLLEQKGFASASWQLETLFSIATE